MRGKGGDKKGSGDSFFDNPFGGIFDFNGDGKEDLSEQWLGYKIFEDITKEEKRPGIGLGSGFFGSGGDSDHSWRLTCEDGSEFGIDPEDYETEEEYDEALEEAKYAWRLTCEDGSDFGIDPENYETEEEYEEALEEAKHVWRFTCEDGSVFGVDPENYETEDEYEEALEEAKYAWRLTCEDGSEFGVAPEDYETEEEYDDALEEAKYAWRENCEDMSKTGVDPENYETEWEYNDAVQKVKELLRLYASADSENSDSEEYGEASENTEQDAEAADDVFPNNPEKIKPSDYPNKRRYNAARFLADPYNDYSNTEYRKKEKRCCKFILEKADSVLAANYLSYDSGFLYSQAVKEHFELNFSLPDEDEKRDYGFDEMILKIAKRDAQLSFEIWKWCLEQFLPYAEFDDDALRDMTNGVLYALCRFPEDYLIRLVHYMDEHPDFRAKILSNGIGESDRFAEMIVTAIREGLKETAQFLFDAGLAWANGQWRKINELVDCVINQCKIGEELEIIEYFRDEMFGRIKGINIGMVRDEIDEWEKEIADYIDITERESERYAYSRRNAWRKTVPDGEPYAVYPILFSSEQAYLEALEERKHGWRKRFENCDNAGVDPADYETEEEFLDARGEQQGLRSQKEQELRESKLREERELKEKERREKRAALAADKTVYTYCGVLLPFSERPYSYISDTETVRIGDTVAVLVGDSGKEIEGEVVSVGKYMRLGVPYPVEKAKHILRVIPKKP